MAILFTTLKSPFQVYRLGDVTVRMEQITPQNIRNALAIPYRLRTRRP
jgi:hypothetical protein